MSKHAPGPWTAEHDGHGGMCVESADGRQVGFVSNQPEQPANARLIAAAPKLLAALRLCAAVCAGETTTKNGLIEALAAARDAMAEATQG